MNFDRNHITLKVIQVVGCISLFFFICVRSPYLFEKLTIGGSQERGEFYGDLYSAARVKPFKQFLPPADGKVIKKDISEVNQFQTIIIGDSFFWRARGHDTFPYLFAQKINEPVFYDGDSYYNPFALMRDVEKKQKRILILECAERMIYERYFQPVEYHPPAPYIKTKWRTLHEQIQDRWFTKSEKNYRFFTQNFFLIFPLTEWWYTLRFNTTGYIAPETIYSLNPPVLFMELETRRDNPASFYYPFSDETIITIAKNIERIREELLLRYNTELIFMPVPNKYTIQHKMVNNDSYNQFLPRLYKELENRRVPTVKLYEPFLSASEELYFRSDSHWNEKGLSMGLEALTKVFKEVKKQSSENY